MIGVQQEVNVKVPSENYMIGVQQEVNVKVPSEKNTPFKKNCFTNSLLSTAGASVCLF